MLLLSLFACSSPDAPRALGVTRVALSLGGSPVAADLDDDGLELVLPGGSVHIGGPATWTDDPATAVGAWWRVTDIGLEHGFTLAEGPADLRIAVPVRGAVVTRVTGRGARFTLPDGSRLRYDGLTAWDADGRVLPAELAAVDPGLADAGLEIRVDARGARWPVVVDPIVHTEWTVAGASGVPVGDGVAIGDVNDDGYADIVIADGTGAQLYLGSADGPGDAPDWTTTTDVTRAAIVDADGDAYGDLALTSTATSELNVWYGTRSGPGSAPDYTFDAGTTYFGIAVIDGGDLNGDGFHDVVVGDITAGTSNEGGVYVFCGTARGLLGTPCYAPPSGSTSALMGGALAAPGDGDGDGYDELFVGAIAYANGETGEGAGLLWSGSAGGPTGPTETLEGDVASAGCTAVATGDFNADGVTDYAVGCPGYANGSASEGAIIVSYGGSGGLDGHADLVIEGNIASYVLGTILVVGDFDGDGDDDLASGSSGSSGTDAKSAQGLVAVYEGSSSGLSATAGWTAMGHYASRGLGSNLAAGDVDGDGFDDLLIAADDWESSSNVGRVFLVHGSASGLADPYDSLYTELSATTLSADASLGAAVADAGDVNADGIHDLVVTAPESSASYSGYVHVYLGHTTGVSTTPDFSVSSSPGSEMYVDGVGDVDGDGYDDIAYGNPNYDGGRTDQGEIILYYGSASGTTSTGATTLLGGDSGGECGPVEGLGDADGDGYDDFVYGCRDYSNPTSHEGAAFVVYGQSGGPTATGWSVEGGSARYTGIDVAAAGDLDGDGLAEVAVSDLYLVSVWYGRALGYAAAADYTYDPYGSSSYPWATGVGDVNGDGYDDLLYGDYSLEGYAGGLTLLTGTATEPVEAWSATGEDSYDELGYAIAGGDVDGDGFSDIVAGAPLDDDGGYRAGGVYLWYGGAGGPAESADEVRYGQFYGAWGAAVAAVDLDADGFAEIVVGAPDFDDTYSDEGHVEVYAGGPRAVADPGDTGAPDTGGDTAGDTASDTAGDTATDTGGTTTCTTEVCDGVDNDCDGTIDETGPTAHTWYADADADGHGDTSTTSRGCDAPAGYVAIDDDCDDTDAGVHPAALESCDGDDEDCDGTVDEDATDGTLGYLDADGDGYGDASSATRACTVATGRVANGDDCDDGAAGIHPAATENCDGIDEDCDGTADDGPVGSTWYADDDGDGYGDAADTQRACARPTGTVASAGDCDDGSALVSPSGTETCNGDDDDCDGSVDEAGAVGEATSYADADGDGFGGASATVSCTAPAGAVSTGDDCDDGDAGVHPGAPETCDGADDDCDGSIDDGTPSDAATWFADGDGDGVGDAAQATRACIQPAGHAASGGDCDDRDATVLPGAPETCDGADDDCDGAIDDGAGPTWHRDADADGWGADADAQVSCTAPDGFVEAGGDCDDTRRSISPDATEICGGGDEDCDGAVDEDDAQDAALWYADGDADGYGDPDDARPACAEPAGYAADGTDCDDADAAVSGAPSWFEDSDGDGFGATETVSCDPPAGTVAEGGDCDEADANVSPGAEEVWYDGVDQDCDGNDVDQDGDGVGVAGDCDDLDPAVTDGCAIDAPDGDKQAACGCASGGSSLAWAPALLGLLALRRREVK